jgi:hypothetical protein
MFACGSTMVQMQAVNSFVDGTAGAGAASLRRRSLQAGGGSSNSGSGGGGSSGGGGGGSSSGNGGGGSSTSNSSSSGGRQRSLAAPRGGWKSRPEALHGKAEPWQGLPRNQQQPVGPAAGAGSSIMLPSRCLRAEVRGRQRYVWGSSLTPQQIADEGRKVGDTRTRTPMA